MGIRRIQNDNWRNITTVGNDTEPVGYEKEMKTALSIAPDKIINVYITTFPSTFKKGTSTFPWNNFALTVDNAYFGIVIRPTVFPGSSDPRNNLGMVLVHEMGHMLGLLHTFFEDDLCKPTDPDECSDTQPHIANVDCDSNNKACDGISAAPVHNYMNYVTDECMTEFTPLQRQRMNQKIQQYRPNIGGTTITINNDITVIAGSSLQLMGDATLNFTMGKKVVNNGSLSCSNITFTSSSSWGGIQFNSGSSGNLQYCNIQNAGNGIYCYNSSPTIKYSTIDNNSSTGLYLNYYSSPVLKGNNFRFNGSYGIRCESYSSPNLTDYGYPGLNVIRNNGAGIVTSYYSNPNLNG